MAPPGLLLAMVDVVPAGALVVAVTLFEVTGLLAAVADDNSAAAAAVVALATWLKEAEPADDDRGLTGGEVVSADGVVGNGGYEASRFL